MVTLELLAFAVVGLFLTQSIYHLFFHPLRKYPGPLLWRISNIPRYFHTVRGNNIVHLTALHRKYGQVVRIGPSELSYIDPRAWPDIYGGARAYDFKKDITWLGGKVKGLADNMLITGKEDHQRQRRAFQGAFTEKAVKSQEAIVAKYADQLVSALEAAAQKDETVNLVDMFNFTTFDTIADLAFGQPLSLLKTQQYNKWVQNVFMAIKFAVWSGTIAKILGSPLDGYFNDFLMSLVKEETHIHMKYGADMVKTRLDNKDASKRPDVWTYVLSPENDHRLTREEMYANAGAILIAGSETTATLLSGLSFHLLNNPDAYGKLKREVRGAFSSDEDMSFAKLQELTYLNACISEGLRMYPPVAGGSPRYVPKGGAEICGEYVPGGTVVSFSQFPAYSHPSNFTQPESFLPQRWLKEDPKFHGDKYEALQPFSVGSRNCLGKPLAMHEMRLILAKTVLNLDFVLLPASKGFLNQKVFLVWEKKPLLVTVRSVKAS